MKNSTIENQIKSFVLKLFRKSEFSFINDFENEFPESKIYFVGGAVRDIILKREASDFDFVVTNISKKELETFLQELGGLVFVGKQFGVYKFTPKGAGQTFDIAFPRTEFSTGPEYRSFEIKTDPKLPIEEDLKRRDFTINALAFDIFNKKLIDISKGLKDLQKRIIRTVGKPKERFAEDYTRMLRAIRQAVELDFEIEKKTFAAIKKEAPRLIVKGKAVVPFEMISEEFLKSFNADHLKTIKLYDKAGLLKVIFPELEACKKLRQPKNYHPEIFLGKHNLIVLSKISKEDSLRLKLAALFHDIGKVKTKKIQTVKGKRKTTFYNHEDEGAQMFKKLARRLRFPLGLTNETSFLIRYHLFLWHGNFLEMRMTTLSKIFLEDVPLGNDLLKLHFADVSREGKEKQEDISYLKEAQKYIKKLQKEVLSSDNKIELPVTGSDMISEFSLKEGPIVGAYLLKAHEYYLKKAVKQKKLSKAEILEFLKKNPPSDD